MGGVVSVAARQKTLLPRMFSGNAHRIYDRGRLEIRWWEVGCSSMRQREVVVS